MNSTTQIDLLPRNCFHCDKEPPQEKPFSRCGGCKAIRYCSAECQRQSWKTHKAVCPILASFKPLPGPDAIVCNFRQDDQLTPLTQEQFYKKTGMRFCLTNRASPKFVTEKMTSNPVSLIPEVVDPHFTSSLYLEDHPQLGLGLKTKDPIPADKVICHWLGELRSKESRKTYKFATYGQKLRGDLSIDPSKTSSFAAFANDGPPNCATKFGSLQGQITCLTSLRPLSQDEWIYVDYGPDHLIKAGSYFLSENSMDLMHAFCNQHDVYNPKTDYETRMRAYIFTTFAAFMKLHLKKALCADETLSQLDKNEPLQKIASQGCFFKFYKPILRFISKYKDNPEILEKLNTLGNPLTLRCYCQVLLTLMEKETLSDQRFNELLKFGHLIDQLYLWTHGTLIGSYWGKLDEPDQEPFDLPNLKADYDTLPPDLKRHFLKQVVTFANYCKETRDINSEKRERQAQALSRFALELGQRVLSELSAADNKGD